MTTRDTFVGFIRRVLLCASAILIAGCATDPTVATGSPPDKAFGAIVSVVRSPGDQSLSAEYESARSAYLTDPTFKCRHPILSRHLAGQVQSLVGEPSCQDPVPFNVVARQKGSQTLWIDPKVVRNIHLLFAGKGTAMMSRFGHVSLRLIVCPSRASDEKACDENLAQHLVVGFGAHVNDLEIDLFKALRGGYRASLFASRFMDAYRDYAIDEFREMYSLPLALTTAQREDMVRELSEIHWSYAGTYDFFSSNCSSLLQRALRVIWPESVQSPSMAQDFMRPDRFFTEMRTSSLSLGSLLNDLEQAERDGYYFPSTEPFYVSAVTLLQRSMLEPAFDDIDSYLELPPSRRLRSMENDPAYLHALSGDRHLMGAQIMMEELAVQRSERALLVKAAQFFHELMGQDHEKWRRRLSERQSVAFEHCLVGAVSLVTQPVIRTNGIPRKEEVPPPIALPPICNSSEGRRALVEALEMNGRTSPGWNELNQIAQYWADSVSNVVFLRGDSWRRPGNRTLR